MPEWIAKLLEWLKTPAHYFLPVLVASAFGLFAPLPLLEALGVGSWRVEGKPYLGFFFVISASVVICHYGAIFVKSLWREYRLLRFKRVAVASLKTLSTEEKELLARYLQEDAKVLYFAMHDNMVSILVNNGILQPTLLKADITEFPFNITPWCREELQRNPHLVGVKRSGLTHGKSKF